MRHDEILGLLPRLNFGQDSHFGLRLLLLELLFWLAVTALTVVLLRFRPTFLEETEQRLARISLHTRAWLVAFGLVVVVIRLGLVHWIPVPIPVVHDEFSFLLGADTFAHGRVTNPPHPMAVHFESFHINIRPTYQSMYPPAQAFALAVGQKLTGEPWIGVVLTTALMCAAVYWMLLGWLPAPWAWLGGAFVVVRYGIFSYWINSYFGGSIAGIGGAIVLGALPRLRRQLTARTLVVFAIGLFVLASSRPLEGFMFSLPVMAAVIYVIVKKGSWPRTARQVLPAIALLATGFAWQLYYNWRGTEHPFLMPYVLNYRTYHISNPFLFLKPNPIPEYAHPAMRAFYVFHEYIDVARLRYWERDALEYMFRLKGAVFYSFYLWPFLFLVAPAIYKMCRDKDFRIVLISVASLGGVLALEMWPSEAHYGAAGAGAVILLVLYSLRHFRNSHSGYGMWAARATALTLGLWMLSPIAERLHDPMFLFPPTAAKTTEEAAADHGGFWVPLEINRARIEADLENRPGKHLIIAHHQYHDAPAVDWVYNAADIDKSKVIWARDMGYFKNKELLEYYPDRHVWYVDRGDMMALIKPYDEGIFSWKLVLDSPPFGPMSSDGWRNAGNEGSPKPESKSGARLVTVSKPIADVKTQPH